LVVFSSLTPYPVFLLIGFFILFARVAVRPLSPSGYPPAWGTPLDAHKQFSTFFFQFSPRPFAIRCFFDFFVPDSSGLDICRPHFFPSPPFQRYRLGISFQLSYYVHGIHRFDVPGSPSPSPPSHSVSFPSISIISI